MRQAGLALRPVRGRGGPEGLFDVGGISVGDFADLRPCGGGDPVPVDAREGGGARIADEGVVAGLKWRADKGLRSGHLVHGVFQWARVAFS